MRHVPRFVVRAAKPVVRAHSGFVGSIVAVDTAVRKIVLTYDDGPEPGGTDSILKVLDERKLSATFFVLLSRARRHPGLLGEVVAAGHEVALHGLDHQRLTGFSFREVAQRTRDGRAELEDLTGSKVEWVRPPYGRQTLASWRAVQSAGVKPVMWSATSWDSKEVHQTDRIRKAMTGAAPGAILLSHDGHAGPADGVDDGPSPSLDRGELT
ncbi:MAG: Peptidoglycan/xylan/chitin deacetylase, PgdA/CDA1 family, partial [Micrococcaceae bacterium]|nr:Peptidoglycan/xylan/chitin deacetylase, PgdA/CDA1 family [Micrococcaceae bacterium]